MTFSIDPLSLANRYAERSPTAVFELLADLHLGPEFQELDDNISGWIERRQGGGYKVVINRKHALVRRRFTAAHELGHYIYHRDLLGRGVGDTRAYRAHGTHLDNPLIQPTHERQANTFAANLLMPRPAIARLMGQGVQSTEALAEQFQVSRDAMKIRLGRA